MPAPAAPHYPALEPAAAASKLGTLPSIRDHDLPLGRLGSLEVRLAETAREVRRAQRLRYRVFYKERGARPDLRGSLTRLDADPFDEGADHLLVLDHNASTKRFRRGDPKVVGTYRLLRQGVAASRCGFYTSGEFDIAPLIARHPGRSFLELGRSCVAPRYRDRRTIELLWAGIWAYVRRHGVDVLLGCASFEGTDPARHAPSLDLLRRLSPASPEWSAPPLSPGAAPSGPGDGGADKALLAGLPPLIKAYLRLGAMFGEGVAVDRQFGTTDVLVVLPIERIGARYLAHFGAGQNRYAAS